MFALPFLFMSFEQDIVWIMVHITAGSRFHLLFPHRFTFDLQHDWADQQCRAGRADECAGVHSEAAPSRLTLPRHFQLAADQTLLAWRRHFERERCYLIVNLAKSECLGFPQS